MRSVIGLSGVLAAAFVGLSAHAAGSAEHAPASTTAAADEQLLTDIVGLVTDKKRYPVPEAAASKFLAPFSPVKRDEATPESLVYSGERSPGVQVTLDYGKDARGAWTFEGANFYIVSSNGLAAIFQRLDEEIHAKLGDPRWTKKKKGGGAEAMSWKLGKRIKVWLARRVGTVPNEQRGVDHVEITVGEATPEETAD